jgi:hypothetical protein
MIEERQLPPDVILGVPEEVGFFVRAALYGVITTTVYWFMTYEIAGTVLLGAFGGASLVIALYLRRRLPRRRPRAATASSAKPPTEGPFGDDPGFAPNPILAPLEIGFGITLALFAVPFGIWMAVAAVVPIAAGSIAWLDAITDEQRRTFERDTPHVREDDLPPLTHAVTQPTRDASDDQETVRRVAITAAGAGAIGVFSASALGRRILTGVAALASRVVGVILGIVVEKAMKSGGSRASGSPAKPRAQNGPRGSD